MIAVGLAGTVAGEHFLKLPDPLFVALFFGKRDCVLNCIDRGLEITCLGMGGGERAEGGSDLPVARLGRDGRQADSLCTVA